MNESTLKRAIQVREVVNKWYEPGRQDRCYEWIYRTKIKAEFGISSRTFRKYLRITTHINPTGKKSNIYENREDK